MRAVLQPLRAIAEEIVIAVGGPVSDEDLWHYGEIADRLFAIEYAYNDRHQAWLHAQCRGHWILRLDGDEIPSTEMVSEVLAAKMDRTVSSVWFARRHPFPTLERYITQEPWYPDFQARMVRNDGSLRFSGLQHSVAERTLPARIVEAPLYHLPLILSSLEERRARAEFYESLRPGLVAPSGLPTNDANMPELLPTLVSTPVPSEHRRHLESVLGAGGSARGSAVPVPTRVSLEQMDVHWANRPFRETAYRASIAFVGTPVPCAPGERRPVYFRVDNEGDETWCWDPTIGPYLHVVHRVLDDRGTPLGDWQAAAFTEWVRPGMTTVVPASVVAPAEPGRYRLEVRIRHAPERIFGEGPESELVVRPGGAWGR